MSHVPVSIFDAPHPLIGTNGDRSAGSHLLQVGYRVLADRLLDEVNSIRVEAGQVPYGLVDFPGPVSIQSNLTIGSHRFTHGANHLYFCFNINPDFQIKNMKRLSRPSRH